MTVRPQPHEVKQIVVRALLELGVPMPSLFGVKETLFVNRGTCLARSYRAGGLKAVWHVDEGILRFHDAQGNTLRTINLFEELVPQAMAA